MNEKKKHDQSRFSSGTARSAQKDKLTREEKKKSTKNHWKNRFKDSRSIGSIFVVVLFWILDWNTPIINIVIMTLVSRQNCVW